MSPWGRLVYLLHQALPRWTKSWRDKSPMTRRVWDLRRTSVINPVLHDPKIKNQIGRTIERLVTEMPLCIVTTIRVKVLKRITITMLDIIGLIILHQAHLIEIINREEPIVYSNGDRTVISMRWTHHMSQINKNVLPNISQTHHELIIPLIIGVLSR